jgi:23S rRNA (guanosine2251-2'-O)-methyltransferase
MIVYGKNVFSQIQNDPAAIEEVYILNGLKDQKISQSLNKLKNVRISKVSRAQLDKMTSQGIHQGIAAKVKDIQTYSLSELLQKRKSDQPLFIALDEIQDPHNLGAILRTADCAGADGVIICKHNSVGLTPAAIKTSTGAAYTVPVAVVNNMSAALKELKKEGYWIVGTDMKDARDYREGIYDVPLVLVIGSEGKGISPLVKKQCDYMVTLPMRGSISSLNASVAAAILMYEVQNKREMK